MILDLTNGTRVDSSDLRWDRNNYHIYWNSGAAGEIDVTNFLTRSWKFQLFPGFDGTIDNVRIYNETQRGGFGPSKPLVTGTAGIFANQMYNDPFGAPLEQTNKILKKAGKHIAESSGIQVGLVIGAGLLLFLILRR